MAPSTARIYTIDEMLGRWPDKLRRPGGNVSTASLSSHTGIYYLAHILNTHLKKNVALALSIDTTAMINVPELACLPCAARQASNVPREPTGMDSEDEETSPDRYLINLAPHLAEQDGPLQIGF